MLIDSCCCKEMLFSMYLSSILRIVPMQLNVIISNIFSYISYVF